MPSRRAQKRDRIIVVGDGIVASSTGQFDAAISTAKMPPKVAGKHRFMAMASYVMTDAQVRDAHDPAVLKYLDHESLFYLGIGCWDCEQALGEITYDSTCPAPGSDD